MNAQAVALLRKELQGGLRGPERSRGDTVYLADTLYIPMLGTIHLTSLGLVEEGGSCCKNTVYEQMIITCTCGALAFQREPSMLVRQGSHVYSSNKGPTVKAWA